MARFWIGCPEANEAVAFRIPRSSSYCGRVIRHGGWWPDYVVRLFRRGQARYTESLVHERLLPQGPLGTLRSPLMHEAFVALEEVLHKVNSYSTWSAQTMDEQGRRAGLGTAIGRGLWSFLKTYVFRGAEDRLFERSPALKVATSYRPEQMERLDQSGLLPVDFDGDGLLDLCGVGVDGAVAIHRLRKGTSFFGSPSLAPGRGGSAAAARR